MLPAIAVTARPAPAMPAVQRELIDDCSYFFTPPAVCDFAGPVVGTVTYDQDATGALLVVVALDAGKPSRTYPVLLGCGPVPCGSIRIGSLETDAEGRGVSDVITVPVESLQAPPFGPGERNDRVVLVDPDPPTRRSGPGTLVALNITYTVP